MFNQNLAGEERDLSREERRESVSKGAGEVRKRTHGIFLCFALAPVRVAMAWLSLFLFL